MAIGAALQMRHAELQLRSFDGLPEADIHLVFQIAARLLLRDRIATSAAKDAREDVAESPACGRTAAPRTFRNITEVESAEIKRNSQADRKSSASWDRSAHR